jgi:hypothetical protein
LQNQNNVHHSLVFIAESREVAGHFCAGARAPLQNISQRYSQVCALLFAFFDDTMSVIEILRQLTDSARCAAFAMVIWSRAWLTVQIQT